MISSGLYWNVHWLRILIITMSKTCNIFLHYTLRQLEEMQFCFLWFLSHCLLTKSHYRWGDYFPSLSVMSWCQCNVITTSSKCWHLIDMQLCKELENHIYWQAGPNVKSRESRDFWFSSTWKVQPHFIA